MPRVFGFRLAIDLAVTLVCFIARIFEVEFSHTFLRRRCPGESAALVFIHRRVVLRLVPGHSGTPGCWIVVIDGTTERWNDGTTERQPEAAEGVTRPCALAVPSFHRSVPIDHCCRSSRHL